MTLQLFRKLVTKEMLNAGGNVYISRVHFSRTKNGKIYGIWW